MPTVYATNRKRIKERRAKKFANMRAAKERLRMERAFAEPLMPDLSHCEDICAAMPRIKPLFIITITCSDGESVKLRLHDGPHGLMPSATSALRRIGAVLKHYRPAKL